MIPGNAPRPSDSDSSVELMLEDRRTIINFSDALAATHEDGEDYDHDDDDSEFNFTERNAEVTFDGALDYGDEHEATMDPGVDAAIAPGSKSKTWNRFLRRSRPKGGSTAEKKSHTLGDHFRPSAFSKARAGNQREHTLKHFHLSRNRSAKQEAKPTEQLLLRYRLCPYGKICASIAVVPRHCIAKLRFGADVGCCFCGYVYSPAESPRSTRSFWIGTE